MSDLASFDTLVMTLGFIVPGLIVLFVRAQFVTGWGSSQSTALLSYFTVSVIYWALILPFVDLEQPVDVFGVRAALMWFALVIVGPAILGLILGIDTEKGLLRHLLQRCGLNPVHAMPTAWDWKFTGMVDQWVLVTLKDGDSFAGFCGDRSFMSSDPGERDIYIQWLYDVDDAGNWSRSSEKGILITAGEIRSIEFWPFVPQEDNDEKV